MEHGFIHDIVAATNSSKGLLKAKFAKTPKRLGDWGYQVDNSPKAKKVPAPKMSV